MIGQRGSGKNLTRCTSVRFLENGDELFPAMLADIHAATDSVYLYTYIFQHDLIGRQFISPLVAAQSRGIDIKVLVDGLGELAYPPRVGKALRDAGLHFAHFDPIRLFPPSLHINPRNHRKMLIVDQKLAYTGGHNISAKHLVKDPAVKSLARYLHTRLEGATVSDIERAFIADWERGTGEALENH
jgi:cardiolipin synthase